MKPARERIIPIFVPHEGCPHDCVFCNQRRIAAPRSPEPEEVRGLLEEAIPRQNGERAEAAFYGGSFTAIPAARQEALLGAAEPFVRAGKLSGLRVSTRPDCIDGPTLDRLSRYFVRTVELGAQSMDDRVLALSNRGHTADDTRRAAALVRERGFRLILQVMTGLPGDTRESTLYTARETAALRPDGVRIYPVAVIRDTALYDAWVDGTYRALTPGEGAGRAADMLEIFLREGIPVIRIGLNPTAELDGGAVAAGAYHPALGEMARSCLLYRRAAAQLAAADAAGRSATLWVCPRDLSAMNGLRRENAERIVREFGLRSLRVRPCAQLLPYEVRAEIRK